MNQIKTQLRNALLFSSRKTKGSLPNMGKIIFVALILTSFNNTANATGVSLNYSAGGAEILISSQGTFDLTSTQPNGVDGTKCITLWKGTYPDDSTLANGGCYGSGNGSEWGSAGTFGIGGTYTNGSGTWHSDRIANCPDSYCTSSGDGDYWISFTPFTCGSSGCLTATTSDYYYVSGLSLDSGVWTQTGFDYTNTDTRIISIEPHDLQIETPDFAFLMASEFYVNTTQFSDNMFLRFRWKRNQDDQSAVALVAAQGGNWTTYDFPTDDWTVLEGYNTFATTTTIHNTGQYTLEVQLRKTSLLSTIGGWFGLGNFFDSGLVVSSSTQFIVGEQTPYDLYVASSSQGISNFIASTTISTDEIKSYCSLSTSFSFVDCLASLFVPNQQDLDATLSLAEQNIFTHFPFGYVNDFIQIVSTTTEGSLVALNATTSLPILGNAHITLDLSHQLDYVLNATTSSFTNESASSTETFYDITSYYWKIIVYLSAVFYLLWRIIGSGAIVNPWHKKDIS